MNRRWYVRLAWGLLLAPQLGCVALPQAFTPPAAPNGSNSQEAVKPLPAGETAQICLKLGDNMSQQGHLKEATLQYEKARQCNPKLDLSYKLALLYDQQGDYVRAVAEYERAVETHPRDANLLNDFGYCHYNRADWVKAEKALRQAVEVDPKNGRAWTNLGMTLGMQGYWEEARIAFSRVVGPAEAESNVAFLLATQGKKEEAIQAYRQALNLDPNHRLARAALAKLESPAVEPISAKSPPASPRLPPPQTGDPRLLPPQISQPSAAPSVGEAEAPPPIPRKPVAK